MGVAFEEVDLRAVVDLVFWFFPDADGRGGLKGFGGIVMALVIIYIAKARTAGISVQKGDCFANFSYLECFK